MMKRYRLIITHTVEVELDARVQQEDIDWGVQQTFHEWSDGRRPFSVETMLHGLQHTINQLAYYAQGALASRICQKYPGAAQKSYLIENKLPPYAVGRVENDAHVEMLEAKNPCSFCDAIPVTNECLETCASCGERTFRVFPTNR